MSKSIYGRSSINLTVDTLSFLSITANDIDATNSNITGLLTVATENASTINASIINADTINISSLDIDSLSVIDLSATNIIATDLSVTDISTTNIIATDASINTLDVSNGTITNLTIPSTGTLNIDASTVTLGNDETIFFRDTSTNVLNLHTNSNLSTQSGYMEFLERGNIGWYGQNERMELVSTTDIYLDGSAIIMNGIVDAEDISVNNIDISTANIADASISTLTLGDTINLTNDTTNIYGVGNNPTINLIPLGSDAADTASIYFNPSRARFGYFDGRAKIQSYASKSIDLQSDANIYMSGNLLDINAYTTVDELEVGSVLTLNNQMGAGNLILDATTDSLKTSSTFQIDTELDFTTYNSFKISQTDYDFSFNGASVVNIDSTGLTTTGLVSTDLSTSTINCDTLTFSDTTLLSNGNIYSTDNLQMYIQNGGKLIMAPNNFYFQDMSSNTIMNINLTTGPWIQDLSGDIAYQFHLTNGMYINNNLPLYANDITCNDINVNGNIVLTDLVVSTADISTINCSSLTATTADISTINCSSLNATTDISTQSLFGHTIVSNNGIFGDLSVNEFTSPSITCDDLEVVNDISCGGSITSLGINASASNVTLANCSTLSVSADADISGDLTVNGNSYLNSRTTVIGGVHIDGSTLLDGSGIAGVLNSNQGCLYIENAPVDTVPTLVHNSLDYTYDRYEHMVELASNVGRGYDIGMAYPSSLEAGGTADDNSILVFSNRIGGDSTNRPFFGMALRGNTLLCVNMEIENDPVIMNLPYNYTMGLTINGAINSGGNETLPLGNGFPYRTSNSVFTNVNKFTSKSSTYAWDYYYQTGLDAPSNLLSYNYCGITNATYYGMWKIKAKLLFVNVTGARYDLFIHISSSDDINGSECKLGFTGVNLTNFLAASSVNGQQPIGGAYTRPSEGRGCTIEAERIVNVTSTSQEFYVRTFLQIGTGIGWNEQVTYNSTDAQVNCIQYTFEYMGQGNLV